LILDRVEGEEEEKKKKKKKKRNMEAALTQ
jgi:hypothetical protein